MSRSPSSITKLLSRWQENEPGAFEDLIDQVYAELRAIAHNVMSLEKNKPFQTTGLVHEIYADLGTKSGIDWQDRNHFFKIASIAMRRALIHEARRGKALKRDADLVSADETLLFSGCGTAEDWLLFDSLLRELELQDTCMAKIVQLKVFCGYTNQETADSLGISIATVKRRWSFAKAWIYKRSLEPDS
ncbi:ECF sigma factor [Sulfidibacter corallicola]|uniref:RNA polymerase sigma-70 ECF-like HTH domain-containing protein n=1 Tax=Sulfidibacter corallicola TaxID=2818388 RepID=A0A8A4TW42_SULCO|nr:ECF-type sigma factor [Sulfidibacter corallicola]QTD50745.1 hypothetical protein J3U87_34605 [Sulfidibacter corallicola]